MRDQIKTLRTNQQLKEGYFSQKNTIVKDLQEEVQKLRDEKAELDRQIALLAGVEEIVEYTEKSLRAARAERDSLQKDMRALTSQAFFQKDNDKSLYQKINGLETEIEKHKRDIEQRKKEMLNMAEKKGECEKRIKELSVEIEKFLDESNRIRYI